jgi:hypothetical protein
LTIWKINTANSPRASKRGALPCFITIGVSFLFDYALICSDSEFSDVLNYQKLNSPT